MQKHCTPTPPSHLFILQCVVWTLGILMLFLLLAGLIYLGQ